MRRGSGGTTSIFSSNLWLSHSLKRIHCIAVCWAKQFRYNQPVSNWGWTFLGHFSRWLLLVQQLHSHNSSDTTNNKRNLEKLTLISLYLKSKLNHNGLFRNQDEDSSTCCIVIFFHWVAFFNIVKCNYIYAPVGISRNRSYIYSSKSLQNSCPHMCECECCHKGFLE